MKWFLRLIKTRREAYWKKRYSRFFPILKEGLVTIAIKIPAKTWKGVYSWGDYHMAVLLKKQLENQGYYVLLQVLSEWDNDEGGRCDIIIVLRGLSRYKPKPHQINLMWNISHPDNVTLQEYEEYDKVFIASNFWAKRISGEVNVPIEVMLQCTDLDYFHKPTTEEKTKNYQQLLFVGNSRGVYRKVLQDLLPTKYELAVFGKHWGKIIRNKYIKGDYINNGELYKHYGSADILLNDHWQDMSEKGFISNRVYDGLGCGAFILTDKVKEMGEVVNFVQVYETKEQLKKYIQYYLENPNERLKKVEKGMEYVKIHTFKDRAKQFSISIRNLIFDKQMNHTKIPNCNICNSSEFKEGPLGRLTKSGDKPCCVNCGSLERHRLIRTVWELLSKNYLKPKKALQFSLDPSVEVTWFSEHEVSIYEHRNSLDLQKIDREDGAYDIVICNQILEHVEDDKAAFSELLRILKRDGFLQMTVPNPIARQVTDDWGYPKEDFHGHYRHYGLDLIEYFRQVVPNVHMVSVRAFDQVTAKEDYVFFWMKEKVTRDYLLNSFKGKVKVEQYF